LSKIHCTNVCKINHDEINLYRITNKDGCFIEVLNYGATLVSVVVPDKYKQMENVVLSYNNILDYLKDTYYLGSSIGRFANRIRNGRFQLDKTNYIVDRNDNNKHALHGGSSGFNSKIMNVQTEGDSLIFQGNSIDGENGYPGNLNFQISYTFTNNNELEIKFNASSDKKTPLSLTNHAYFNLSPQTDNILQHELKTYADQYLEMDNEFLPTGKVLSTKTEGVDFSEYQVISKMMSLKKEHIEGYNTYFIKQNQAENRLLKLASVREKKYGRKMDVFSTMPGVMFYTGDFLSTPFKPFGGLCLEAQYYPDFLNHPSFKSCIIGPKKMFEEKIKFVFGIY